MITINKLPLSRKTIRQATLEHHRDRLASQITRFEDLDRRFFWARLAALSLALPGVLLLFVSGMDRPGIALLILAIVSFSVVVYFHRRLDRSLLRFRVSHRLTNRQLARMSLSWADIPQPADLPGEPDHPFEFDLQITGDRSIMHLLDTAVSLGGSRCLRNWLLTKQPDISEVKNRHCLLREVIPLSGFRDHLSLAGDLLSQGVQGHWDGERLMTWLQESKPDPTLKYFIWLLALLALVNIGLFAMMFLAGWPAYWVLTISLYGIIYSTKNRQYRELFGDAYQLGQSLERFGVVFTLLERYPYSPGSQLQHLCRPFWGADARPSGFLRRAAWLISASSFQNNPVLSLFINALLPWDIYFAMRLQVLKSDLLRQLPAWLETWYELEALNSLANFAYLNPDYTFPEVVPSFETKNKTVFSSVQVGHPLIPDSLRVCNDFKLARLGQVVIVSGSNMSGKSTFLRTLGVNLCLAYAGAPVCAEQFRTIPFRVYTSIQISDSLTNGISFFYAEVKRLKALLTAYQDADELPVFCLIDEIYRGTNNRERQIGSRAYVRQLVGGNGVAVISTHDLALVHLADDQKRVDNFHFREEVADGRMIFDYQLHSGPCPTTNALRIMAMEGLPHD